MWDPNICAEYFGVSFSFTDETQNNDSFHILPSTWIIPKLSNLDHDQDLNLRNPYSSAINTGNEIDFAPAESTEINAMALSFSGENYNSSFVRIAAYLHLPKL
jgi:hypothetical protein